ncbi:MAG: BON domain-containing protein, partial [Planctomycetota bacterium]|nr:BON domain-containing protein [Planctomycetota bacterium]
MTAITPSTMLANDREVAQIIAEVMRISGAMKDYSLSVNYSEGTAILRGTVTSQAQMDTAIQIAQASP